MKTKSELLSERKNPGDKAVLYTFDTALDMYKVLFDEEIDYNKLIQVGTLALKSIGTFPIKWRLFIGQSKNYTLEMPCDWINIESVQYYNSFLSWFKQNPDRSTIIRYGLELPVYVSSSPTVEYINPNPNTSVNLTNYAVDITADLAKEYIDSSAKAYVKSNQKGKYLTFNQDDIYAVVYKAAQMDDEENLMFNEESMLAICYYTKWIKEQAKPTMSSNIQYWMQMKDKYISMARNAGGLSDNSLDRLMDIYTSHNRKKFGFQLLNNHR